MTKPNAEIVALLIVAIGLLPGSLAGPAAAPVPSDLPGNLAWWSADDRTPGLTVTDVTVPADLTTWKDPNAKPGFTVTGGQPDPLGGTRAYSVMENSGATYRWLACAPSGYVPGPCHLSFYYKPVNGASAWACDGSVFFPEFEFGSEGFGRVGKHPYAAGDNSWFRIAPAAKDFFRVDLWLQGAGLIRSGVALSTVSNGAVPAAGDARRGVQLYGVTFSQQYATALQDRSPNAAHLTATAATAPFLQRSADGSGLLTGGSCLWQPDETRKYLATDSAALSAALSGTAPSTVLALVRRQWCRGEGLSASAFLQCVATTGNDYAIGFTAGGGAGAGNRLYAGVSGKSGPAAALPSDTEWNAVAVINTGSAASIYLLDNEGARLIAGPTPVSRGTIGSVRLCAERCAVRELAVWNRALEPGAAQAQARGMIARAGGQAVLNTLKTVDGVTIETRTKSAPYHWRDDSGVAFFAGACWIVAGAVETVSNSSDVWKSTDYGATWTEVKQLKPFAPSQGAAAFPLTVGGTAYLYYVACYERTGGDQSIFRSTDGATWEKVCESPPWKNNFGLAVGLLGSDIYVMGGQTKGRDPDSARSSVYKSTDGGATWTQLPDAPWRPRMAFGPLLPLWRGKLWLVHGGTYAGFSGKPSQKFDDVWSFDGTTWVRVLEHTPWSGTLWSTSFVLQDDLFVMAGWAQDGDHRMMWRTSDGVHWRSSFPLPWSAAHESCATTTDRGVLLAPTDWNQTTRLLK